MRLGYKILIGFLSFILILVGGLFIWYEFVHLRKPQVFLVAKPWSTNPVDYDEAQGKQLAAKFSGRLITKAELQQALDDGMYVRLAGYLTDVTQRSTGCKDNPYAYFTDVGLGVKELNTACSMGYFVYGVKPTETASDAGDGFSVKTWNQESKTWNRYEISSLKGLWDALTGKA